MTGPAGPPPTRDLPRRRASTAATVAILGQGLIATPGGIDTHVHLVTPRLIPVALAAGMTTLGCTA